MPTKPITPVSFRLDPADADLFTAVMAELSRQRGKTTRTDVIRYALRLAAREMGIEPAEAKRK